MKKILSTLLGFLILAMPVFAQDTGTIQFLERLGFGDILLWLLTFAIVYGILAQVNIPKSNASRAIIGIVAGFLVLLAAPASLIIVLSKLSSSLILVVLGILLVFIFLEVAGIKHIEYKEQTDKEGRRVQVQVGEFPFFQKHPYTFAIFFIIIAILIFVGSGGMSLLGIQVQMTSTMLYGVIFLVLIILAVMWMIAEKPEKR